MMELRADASAEEPSVDIAASGFDRRRQASRRQLEVAALAEFSARGYLATSVEDIAASAHLSRMTFYRHFASKAQLAIELFRAEADKATPRMLAIASMRYADPDAVRAWLSALFAADLANRRMLRAYIQATSEESDFADRAHEYIAALIVRLGQSIPAFAVDSADPMHRRRWLEAWLLLYEILDQSNHAALSSGVAEDPLVLDILVDRFLLFVNSAPS